MQNSEWHDEFAARLRAFDWENYCHAFGKADDVPDQLLMLLEENSKTRKDAWELMWTNLVHQGTRYSATLAALPFLTEMLRHMKHGRVWMIYYLVNVALGSHNWHYPSGYVQSQGRGAYMNETLHLELYQAVQDAAYPVFVELARDIKDEGVCCIALWSLAWFPAKSQESSVVLEAANQRDQELVRGAAQFSLQLLNHPVANREDADDEQIEKWEDESDEFMRRFNQFFSEQSL